MKPDKVVPIFQRKQGKTYLTYMTAIRWAIKNPNKKVCIASSKHNLFIKCEKIKELENDRKK